MSLSKWQDKKLELREKVQVDVESLERKSDESLF